ncbi:MAG: hypothetical protein ACOX8U_03340 [Bradymonadia bacterium]
MDAFFLVLAGTLRGRQLEIALRAKFSTFAAICGYLRLVLHRVIDCIGRRKRSIVLA